MYGGDYQSVIAGMILAMGIVVGFSAILGLVMYVFESIGMYSISRRRIPGTSGFAWIPILRWFKLGQIADDAVLHKRGSRTHFMVLMPVFQIAGGILTGIGGFLALISFDFSTTTWHDLLQNGSQNIMDQISRGEISASAASLTAGMIFLAVGYILVVIASVMMYICYYHIFKSCAAGYIAFFVLSLVFPVTIPFFLFAVRKKDNPSWYQEVSLAEEEEAA